MQISRHFDQIAIVLSAVCIVHCLAVPVLIAGLPIVAVSFGNSEHFHGVMLWLVVPTSFFGFILGYRLHQRPGLVALGALGVAILAAVAIWGHEAWGDTLEIMISVAGSLILATAHWLNFRAVRRCHQH